MTKPKGFPKHDSYASSTERSTMPSGSRPRVGQSKPYGSGANAHNKHEPRKAEPAGGPRMPLASSKKGYDY